MVLLAIVLYGFASGFFEAVLFPNWDGRPPLSFFHAIIIAILIFVWCRLHAKVHDVQEKAFACFTALLPPVGVPLYLFRAFGIKGGLIGTLKSLGFFLIVALLYALGSMVGGRTSS
jgi:hypothetical protein